jgi:2-polyprenyl-3-methyl-5-hydroxy-6-metoxy-1,4-benzoquinol methylase
MATDYDPIAEQYKRSKLQRWRAHVEAFTLMKLVDDLAGKAVVDVACGEGFYTRILRQRGAAKVTGLDLSPKMIGLASNSEVREPLGIEIYRQRRARYELRTGIRSGGRRLFPKLRARPRGAGGDV